MSICICICVCNYKLPLIKMKYMNISIYKYVRVFDYITFLHFRVFVQVLCSYSILPLYAIVVQVSWINYYDSFSNMKIQTL